MPEALIEVTLLKDQEFMETGGLWPGWPIPIRAFQLTAGESININKDDAERMIREGIAKKKV